MSWFDTKNKHQHVIVTANAWDMQRIEAKNRKRKWFIFLDILAVVCLLIGIGFIYYDKNYTTGAVFIILGLFIFLYFVFRKKTQRSKHRNFRGRRRRRN